MRRPAAGWRQRRETFDITWRFAPVHRAALEGRRVLPKDAGQHVYLLVPGAFGNQMPGYFKAVHRHLLGKGLEVHRSQIHTLADVATNAKVLRDEILALAHPPTGPPRQVVLITHSKGGADALVADAEYPELHGEIRAMLLLQPAYDQGTPLAQLSNNPLTRAMNRGLGGKDGLLHDLAPPARRDFSASRPRRTSVPTLVLATSAQKAKRSVLRPMQTVLRFLGHGPSDGMIPQESQLVEGAHAVLLDDVDHAGPVLKMPGASYDPGPLVESLLALTLRLPRR